jgi:hypothetical protein
VVRCASTSSTTSAAAAAAAAASAKQPAKPNKEERQSSAAKAIESPSFAMNLFRGQLKLDEIFPYPYALNDEQRDTLQALVDPTAKFFEVFTIKYRIYRVFFFQIDLK